MKELTTPEIHKPINLNVVPELQEVQVRDGVVLRPLEPTDADSILEILGKDESVRDRVSVAAQMHSAEDVAEQVRIYKADEHLLRYALLDGNRCVGLVSFWRDVNNPFDAPDNPDDYGFGYFLDPAERGKGLVTDAVQRVMDVAEDVLHINQFVAFCEDNNADSVAVLSKLGFQPTDITFTEQNNGWVERKFVRTLETLTEVD